MVERRNSAWVFLAIGAMALLVALFAWSALRGGQTTAGAVRAVTQAVPDIRPRLPEAPHLPKSPIPIPK